MIQSVFQLVKFATLFVILIESKYNFAIYDILDRVTVSEADG